MERRSEEVRVRWRWAAGAWYEHLPLPTVVPYTLWHPQLNARVTSGELRSGVTQGYTQGYTQGRSTEEQVRVRVRVRVRVANPNPKPDPNPNPNPNPNLTLSLTLTLTS